MSRRAKKIEKRVSVDPKFNSELIAHVIRVIMKDGKMTGIVDVMNRKAFSINEKSGAFEEFERRLNLLLR